MIFDNARKFYLYDQNQSSVDSQLSDMCYYKYNIEDKTTTFLGKIDDWHLTSSDYTFNQKYDLHMVSSIYGRKWK